MTNSPDDEIVALDDLALELCSGAKTIGKPLGKPLGPPTRAEVQKWLHTKLDQKNPELTGWKTNEAAMKLHCASVVTHQALDLLNRIR